MLTDAQVQAARADTPGAEQVIHLNHAGSSLPSSAVLDRQIKYLQREAAIGGYEAAAEHQAATEQVYDSLARLIGASAHEVARLEHATAAWNAGFWSVPMKPGQRILTAQAAYGANAVAFLRAVERRGVRIDVVPDDEFGQVDVAELARRLDDDVALVAITHVPTNGGLVNPAEAIGALTKSAGIPYLLDACQSVGQIELDVTRIGCDLLSGTGRKYLRGPRGTGFLYVSEHIAESLHPDQPDHHGADWVDPATYRLVDGAQRYESWEYNHAAWLGLGVAVDEALALGLDRIEPTVRAAAERLRARLTNAGYQVMDLGQQRCGIVTIACDEATVVRDRLRAIGINTSVTTPASTWYDAASRNLGDMLRVSVHYLTVDAEIDRLILALGEISEAKAES